MPGHANPNRTRTLNTTPSILLPPRAVQELAEGDWELKLERPNDSSPIRRLSQRNVGPDSTEPNVLINLWTIPGKHAELSMPPLCTHGLASPTPQPHVKGISHLCIARHFAKLVRLDKGALIDLSSARPHHRNVLRNLKVTLQRHLRSFVPFLAIPCQRQRRHVAQYR